MKTTLFTSTLSGCIFLTALSSFIACTNQQNSADSNNNEAQAQQNMIDRVEDSAMRDRIKDSIARSYSDTTKNYVFLTWDDGPQPPGTINCRNTFKELDVKASFFAVGFNILNKERELLMDSIRRDYPALLLVNHGFSHAMNNRYQRFYSPASIDTALNDFLHNERLMQITEKIVRFPGHNTWAVNGMISGQLTKKPLVHRLDSLGYQVIGWDTEWRGSGKTQMPRESATEMANRVLAKLSSGETRIPGAVVVLSHDRFFAHQDAVDSLKTFILLLKADPRIHFETIDHYQELHRNRRSKSNINLEN